MHSQALREALLEALLEAHTEAEPKFRRVPSVVRRLPPAGVRARVVG